MDSLIDSWNAAAELWLGCLWPAAWQWALLAVGIAWPLQALFCRRAPAARYWIWQAVIVKLLLAGFWSIAIPVPWPVTHTPVAPADFPVLEPAELPPARVPTSSGRDAVPQDVAPIPRFVPQRAAQRIRPSGTAWLALAWLAGVLAQVARLALQRRRLNRLLMGAVPADGDLTETVRRCADSLGLAAPVRTLVIEQDASPFACGILNPTLVLPDGFAAGLGASQLRHVLLHELAHLRRRDLLWGWIPEVARLLWFFHPVVHWVVYRLRLERELACDQLAISRSGNDPAAYAATLVQVVTQFSNAHRTWPLAAAAVSGDSAARRGSAHEH